MLDKILSFTTGISPRTIIIGAIILAITLSVIAGYIYVSRLQSNLEKARIEMANERLRRISVEQALEQITIDLRLAEGAVELLKEQNRQAMAQWQELLVQVQEIQIDPNKEESFDEALDRLNRANRDANRMLGNATQTSNKDRSAGRDLPTGGTGTGKAKQ
jgi:hypothetical protein